MPQPADDRPLRVLFVEVAGGELGADYSVHAQLARTLGPTGSVELMSLSHPDLARDHADDMTRVACSAYDRSGGRVRRRLSVVTDLPPAIRGAMPVVEEFDPDVIYSSQMRRDVLAAHLVSAASRRPHIVHLHYSFGPWLGWAATRSIRRARHIVAISEYVRQTALLRGIDEDRVSTIPNLVDPAPPRTRDRDQVRADLEIGDDQTIVLAVGRLDPGKGYAELLDAVAALPEHHDDVRVLVCGESNHFPEHGPWLRGRAQELGVERTVQFLGQRSDVADLMAAADIFCLPSKQEPFGLVYVEAMRASLPVVALASGGVPEIVLDGVTGLLSYPGDDDRLRDNLDELIRTPARRRELGEAGRARLDVVFDRDHIADRWATTVRGVVASSGR